ncbi:hypothetical protein [uncultured Maribacter sp.]|uniref:hypothetical protein n=1 Tax=uncultured Maribacter sp. TaxID=431308 RepID=UPI002634F8A0|nr:hypothetical protein [uncultured Maribacter sp.]
MKLKVSLSIILFISSLCLHAQKKSDLINEINSLKTQLDTTNIALAKSIKKGKVNTAKAESLEKQVLDLQGANSTLLKNLNSFAQVSNKNSENITKALASLEEKESQLKIMTDAISSHDSTAVVVLANAKQTLGEDAKINVMDGMVTISKDLTSLFGEDSAIVLIEGSKPWIGKIAAILTANPQVKITIEGLSMTGDLNLPTQQGKAIANSLVNEFGIKLERISVLAKDGGFKEGINLTIHPNYKSFYVNVRKGLKNGSKK